MTQETGATERTDATPAPSGPARSPDLPASFFRTVIETANEGVWMIDCAGRTIFANRRMTGLLGLPTGGLQGESPYPYLMPEDHQLADRVIPSTLSGQAQQFEIRLRHADGTEIPCLASSAPIRDDAGDIIGAMATFSDLTARKAAERALAESEQQARRSAALLTQVLESAADPIWLRDANGVFQVANAATASVMGLDQSAIIGANMRDIWPPEIATKIQEQTEELFRDKRPVVVEERMPDAGKGGTRIYLSNKVPLYHDDGTPMGILGVSRDITERKRAEDELRASEARLATQIAELTALYDSAPIGLAFFSRDYRYLRINEELATINGVPAEDHIGRTIREVLNDQAPAVEPIIDQIFATGEAMRDLEVTGETPQQPGVMRHWLAGFYPVKDEAGAVEAVGAWVIEISERKAAEQRELLLAREVDHRAKNLLAVVQSVMQLTRADTVTELKDAVIGRIQSLARAHALLANSRWEGVELSQLVAEEMAPFTDGKQATISGPPQLLRPAAAQSLGLVLHELATNAAKYGALSTVDGRVDISWEVGGDPPLLVLDWAEHASVPVKPPTTAGFGSRIIKASVERQLQGRVMQEWNPDGLHCRLEFQLRAATPAAKS